MEKHPSSLLSSRSASGPLLLSKTVAPLAWIDLAQTMIKEGKRSVLALITDHAGSTPRERGCWMLVDHEKIYGTLGGGTLEYSAVQAARAMLAGDSDWQRSRHEYLLGPDLGQCCGGGVKFLLEPLDQASSWLLSLNASDFEQADEAYLRIDLENPQEAPAIELDANLSNKNDPHYFIQPLSDNRPALYVFGAGHVGQAIAVTASALPIRLTLVDSRADIMTHFAAPDNCTLLCEDPLSRVQKIEHGAGVVIMTHDHDLDYQLGMELFNHPGLCFRGIIGSKSKTARFMKRYRQAGIADSLLDDLQMPLAQAAPPGKEPGVIALGILHDFLSHVQSGDIA